MSKEHVFNDNFWLVVSSGCSFLSLHGVSEKTGIPKSPWFFQYGVMVVIHDLDDLGVPPISGFSLVWDDALTWDDGRSLLCFRGPKTGAISSGMSIHNKQGLGLMSLFGDFEHHLPISVGDYIPNSWVMFNWDIYQPLINPSSCGLNMNKEGASFWGPTGHGPGGNIGGVNIRFFGSRVFLPGSADRFYMFFRSKMGHPWSFGMNQIGIQC